MCEPLRGKRKNEDEHYLDEFEEGCIQGYNSCLDDVKSAVAFYKKYKESSIKLYEDYPKLYAKYDNETKYIRDEHKLQKEYECWLFDYCFGDVIETEGM